MSRRKFSINTKLKKIIDKHEDSFFIEKNFNVFCKYCKCVFKCKSHFNIKKHVKSKNHKKNKFLALCNSKDSSTEINEKIEKNNLQKYYVKG